MFYSLYILSTLHMFYLVFFTLYTCYFFFYNSLHQSDCNEPQFLPSGISKVFLLLSLSLMKVFTAAQHVLVRSAASYVYCSTAEKY